MASINGRLAALELAKHRIRVNVVCPGAIESQIEQSTQRRDVAAAAEPVAFPDGKTPLTDVLFLASDLADHGTGTELFFDGAESLMSETGLTENP